MTDWPATAVLNILLQGFESRRWQLMVCLQVKATLLISAEPSSPLSTATMAQVIWAEELHPSRTLLGKVYTACPTERL